MTGPKAKNSKSGKATKALPKVQRSVGALSQPKSRPAALELGQLVAALARRPGALGSAPVLDRDDQGRMWFQPRVYVREDTEDPSKPVDDHLAYEPDTYALIERLRKTAQPGSDSYLAAVLFAHGVAEVMNLATMLLWSGSQTRTPKAINKLSMIGSELSVRVRRALMLEVMEDSEWSLQLAAKRLGLGTSRDVSRALADLGLEEPPQKAGRQSARKARDANSRSRVSKKSQ